MTRSRSTSKEKFLCSRDYAYSYLSARIGSIRLALVAGIRPAATDTVTRGRYVGCVKAAAEKLATDGFLRRPTLPGMSIKPDTQNSVRGKLRAENL